MNRIGEGLFLVAAGAALFYGWWGGYFATLIEDVSGRVRGAAPAGTGSVTPLTPAERSGILDRVDALRGVN